MFKLFKTINTCNTEMKQVLKSYNLKRIKDIYKMSAADFKKMVFRLTWEYTLPYDIMKKAIYIHCLNEKELFNLKKIFVKWFRTIYINMFFVAYKGDIIVNIFDNLFDYSAMGALKNV